MALHNSDCFKILNNINKKSIDQIITDPPYFINYENKDWDKESDPLFFYKLASIFNNITKHNSNIILFAGWSYVCNIISIFNKQGFTLKNWIIYDRIKGRGAKTNLVSTREDILWFIKSNNKNKYTYNKIPSTIKKKTKGLGLKNECEFRALSNVWTDISPIVPWSKERVDHPTQKPLKLMERLIKIFSNENDLILDPFMGSGTTGVACKNFNRKFIGIEKDEKYYEIAQKRIMKKIQ